jgi:hypothetical protein
MSIVSVSLQVKYGAAMSAEAIALGCVAEIELGFMTFADGTNYANRNGAETMVYTSVLGQSEMVILGAKAGKDGEASMRADFCTAPGGGVNPLFQQLEAFILGGSFEFEMDPEVFNGQSGKLRVVMRHSLVLDQPASLAVAGGGKLLSVALLIIDCLQCPMSLVLIAGVCFDAAAKKAGCMSQLFSPFSSEVRPEMQKLFSIYDIETGMLLDSVDGSLCYGVAPDGCTCNACRFMCDPSIRLSGSFCQ